MGSGKMVRIRASVFLGLLCLLTACCCLTGCGGLKRVSRDWAIEKTGDVVKIIHREGWRYPQYAALDLKSSYLRLVYGPESGWGTSVILLPSIWVGGRYFQGGEIEASWRADHGNLVISFTGAVLDLQVRGDITIYPPAPTLIHADVAVQVEGEVVLDDRPGEAFKPMMLSSMHVSHEAWDAQYCLVGLPDGSFRKISIPRQGWIINPPARSKEFGLEGGTCAWKRNAPTINVQLDREMEITGWVTATNDPNNDNIGYWAASDEVLPDWSYTVSASEPEGAVVSEKNRNKEWIGTIVLIILGTIILYLTIKALFSGATRRLSRVPEEVAKAVQEVEQATRDGTWYDDSDIYRMDMAIAKAEMEKPGSTLGLYYSPSIMGLMIFVGSAMISTIGICWCFGVLAINGATITFMALGVFLALVVPFFIWLFTQE